MKKLIFFTVLLISVSCVSFSQLPIRPYKQIKLKGSQPLWVSVSFAPEMISDSCDGYNRLFPFSPAKAIIANGSIYNTINTRYNADFGHYVEKIDLETGKLQWRNLLYHKNMERQEASKLSYVDANGDYYLWSYRKENQFGWNSPIYLYYDTQSRVSFRKYSGVNGKVLEFGTPALGDTINSIVTASVVRTAGFSDLIKTNNPDKVNYVQRVTKVNDKFVDNAVIVQNTLNNQGKLERSNDTLDFGEKQYVHNLYQVSTDTLMYLMVDTLTRSKLSVRLMDSELNTFKTVQLEQYPYKIDYNFISIIQFTNSYFVVNTSEVVQGSPYRNIGYAFYDYNGKLLRNFQYLDDNTFWTVVCYIPAFDKYVCAASEFISDESIEMKFVLYEILPDGQLGVINEWRLDDPLIQLGALNLFPVGNDKLLIEYGQTSWYKPANSVFYRIDYFSKGYGFMLWDAKALGLDPSSTRDTGASASIDYQLSPNPVLTEVSVTIPEVTTSMKIEVSNLAGQVIIVRDVNYERNVSLDMSSLASGIYFIKITDYTNRYTYEVKKIAKL